MVYYLNAMKPKYHINVFGTDVNPYVLALGISVLVGLIMTLVCYYKPNALKFLKLKTKDDNPNRAKFDVMFFVKCFLVPMLIVFALVCGILYGTGDIKF
jgi:hypothetical protein